MHLSHVLITASSCRSTEVSLPITYTTTLQNQQRYALSLNYLFNLSDNSISSYFCRGFITNSPCSLSKLLTLYFLTESIKTCTPLINGIVIRDVYPYKDISSTSSLTMPSCRSSLQHTARNPASEHPLPIHYCFFLSEAFPWMAWKELTTNTVLFSIVAVLSDCS